MDSFYYNLKYLFNRYINDGAEYCVNISFSTRNKIKLAILPYLNNDGYGSVPQKVLHSQLNSNSVNEPNGSNDSFVGIQEDTAPVTQFIELINTAMGEILQLLSNDSFQRFSQTEKFKQIYNG